MRTPVGRLPWWGVVAGNVVFWPAWTFACGYAVHRVSAERFASDGVVTRPRGFEDDGHWYEKTLHIQRWKENLPEAGGLFAGGFSKRTVAAGDLDVLERFVAETRRAEMAHWAVTAGVLVPMAWNPWWAAPLHATVAAGSNLPCIAVQRYNRFRLQRVLRRVRGLSRPTSG
ncbi:MAG: hypothetical protein WAN48_00585 [Actinomycetes bacterium]